MDQELSALNSPVQTAGYLGTTTGSLANARYLGTGIPFVRVGRLIRYRRQDILAYIASNTRLSTAEAS